MEVCTHCEREFPEDESWWMFVTPPGERVAAIVSICSEACANALRVQGWTKPTEAEKDRLMDQANRFGRRLG